MDDRRIACDLELDGEWHDAFLMRGDEADEGVIVCSVPTVITYSADDSRDHMVELTIARMSPSDEVTEDFAIILSPAEGRALAAQILHAVMACSEVEDEVVVTGTLVGEA